MSVRSEYGFTKQEFDHALFYNKRKFEVIWEGYGEVDNSPDVNGYLKIDGKYQALYIPENTFCGIRWQAFVYDHTNGTFISDIAGTGSLTRASGGNATYTATAAIGSGTVGGNNFSITPTANTTVQGLEMVLSDSDSAETVSVVVRMEVLIVHTLASGQSRVPAFATAARTTAE